MELSDFAFKKVAILGAGVENLSVVPQLIKQSAVITVCDQSDNPAIEKLKTDFPAIKFKIGEGSFEKLGAYDYIFRSPGFPIAKLSELLSDETNIPIITSVTDLFLSICPSITIGVTGTKGKGTTSTLIGSILEQSNRKVYVVGNIGKPVFEIYEDLTETDFVVLELSSFQLEDVKHSPTFAVVLPISEDHLSPLSQRSPNFHSSMDSYVSAKSNITAFQSPNDLLIYAENNIFSRKIAENSNARKISVGISDKCDYNYTKGGKFTQNGEVILDFNELGIKGEHVFLDAALATALCLQIGMDLNEIKEGIKSFVPLPHRLEKIATIGGVEYWDDSYATAPDAAIAAIKAFKEPLVWIGGGSTKGSDFKELGKLLNQKAKVAILLGQEKDRIAQAVEQSGKNTKVIKVDSMQRAVEEAKINSAAGDVVLLSPACASLDMFKSASDRGEQFVSAVKNENV